MRCVMNTKMPTKEGFVSFRGYKTWYRIVSDHAQAAGVDLTLEIWPHMWHDRHTCVPNLSEANQAIDGIANFVEKHMRMRSTTR
jgi:hypothetical protein